MIHNDPFFGISKRITSWKDTSDFEINLAEEAETNMEARYRYVEYYRKLDPEYFDKGKVFARKYYDSIIDDIKDMSFDEFYADMVYCLHRYGFSFKDYSVFRLYTLNEIGRKRFISDKLRYYYCDILNSPEIEQIMTNKFVCYNTYKEFYKREVVGILPESDVDKFIKFFANNSRFIYKPLTEHSGHGIKIYSREEIQDPYEWFNQISQTNPGVVEELITQSPELSSLNPTSINTCRVVTFDTGDKVEIMAATLRMGTGQDVTDNAGAGGIYAAVDPKTGIVMTDAMNYNSQHYVYHPTTGIAIPGFRLPLWEDAKQLVRKAVKTRPGATLISWDLASYISPEGGVKWCLVEANENGAFQIIQSNQAIGLKQKLYNLMSKKLTDRFS